MIELIKFNQSNFAVLVESVISRFDLFNQRSLLGFKLVVGPRYRAKPRRQDEDKTSVSYRCSRVHTSKLIAPKLDPVQSFFEVFGIESLRVRIELSRSGAWLSRRWR